jgi:hypothetical protein
MLNNISVEKVTAFNIFSVRAPNVRAVHFPGLIHWRGEEGIVFHSPPDSSPLPSPDFTLALVQCSAVQCSAVQCSAVQCSAVLCSASWYINGRPEY